METWVNLIVAILSGLVTAIPLVVELVKYIKKAVQEKNYPNIMKLVMNLMAEAEEKYTDGADKKAYVMAAIKAMEKTLNYEIDEETISIMIDEIIKITKKINVKE